MSFRKQKPEGELIYKRVPVVMTPKEIYQTIKEKPYRDGEALITAYGDAIRDQSFNEVIAFVTELQNDGINFPDGFKHKLGLLKNRLKQ
jgi:hypothetical protein